jgi:hypothetical protein
VSDEPRLLHMRSQYGYTQRPSEAMIGEPEAVSADTQRRLTRDAARAQDERDRELFREAAEHVDVLLARLEERAGMRSQIRAVRRQLEELGRKLNVSQRF